MRTVEIDYSSLKSEFLSDWTSYTISAGLSGAFLISYFLIVRKFKKFATRLGFNAVKYSLCRTLSTYLRSNQYTAAIGYGLMATTEFCLWVDTILTTSGFFSDLINLGRVNVDKTGVTSAWLDKLAQTIEAPASPLYADIYLNRQDIALLVLSTSHYSNAKVSATTATAFQDLYADFMEDYLTDPEGKRNSAMKVRLNFRYKAGTKIRAQEDFDDFLRETQSSLNALRNTYSWQRPFELPVNVICMLVNRSKKIPQAGKIIPRLIGLSN